MQNNQANNRISNNTAGEPKKVEPVLAHLNEDKIKDTSAQDVILNSARKGKRGYVVLAALTLVIFLLSALLFDKAAKIFGADLKVQRDSIQLAVVERGRLQREVAVQGRIVAANSPTLFTPATGSVTLKVRAGQSVNKDDLLAVIDSPELENKFQQEKNQLEELNLEYQRQSIQVKTSLLDDQQKIETAKVDLALAKKNIERAKINIRSKVISQVDFEKQQAELDKIQLQHQHAIESAKLQQENAQFELKAKKFHLERQQIIVQDLERQVKALQIRSPLDGVIGSLIVKEKDTVSQNSPLMTLVDLSAYEIDVQIPENYADDLGVGLKVEVRVDNHEYPAQLIAISPEVSQGQVQGRVRFSEDVPTGIRQNQRISARVLIDTRDQVLKVRRGSFVETGGSHLAFVLTDDLALKREIQLGISSIDEIEIISGLEEGEQIIISTIEPYIQSEKIYIAN